MQMISAMVALTARSLFGAYDRCAAIRPDRARLLLLPGLGTEHRPGRAQARQRFLLGTPQDLFCAGCCRALMLLMCAQGSGSLRWMLLLAAVMAIENHLPWGRHLSAPLGSAWLAWTARLAIGEV